MGNRGEVDWSWISKVKSCSEYSCCSKWKRINAQDVKKAFEETGADGIMIARGAIGNPWIFKEAKELLNDGEISSHVEALRRANKNLFRSSAFINKT